MNKFNFIFKKSFWKNVLAVVVVAILCAGIIGGGIALGKYIKDSKKSPTLNWGRGALDNTGKYYESNNSIYTKDMFECRGLEITPDFGSQVTYKVVFYDDNGEFLSITTPSTTKFHSQSVPLFAKYARVEINAGVVDGEKVEIGLLDILKYRKQLTIKVDKKQSTLRSRLAQIESENCVTIQGTGVLNPSAEFLAREDAPFYFSDAISTSTAKTLIVKLDSATLQNTVTYGGYIHPAFNYYLFSNGSLVGTNDNTDYTVVSELDGFTYVVLNVVNADTVYISVDETSSETVEAYLFN